MLIYPSIIKKKKNFRQNNKKKALHNITAPATHLIAPATHLSVPHFPGVYGLLAIDICDCINYA